MNIQISDSELSVMKVLWQDAPLTSSQILERMTGNKSIMKTMLQRLVAKGALEASPIDGRSYTYTPTVTQADYTAQSSRHFIDKVFDGSSQAMMMNFIRGEQVTVDDLQALIDMLKEENE